MLDSTFQMTAQTMYGLDDILVQELKDLGAKNIVKANRAVSFEGDLRMMYKANLCLRTALRVLVPITEFKVKDENDLYEKIQTIDWEKYLSIKETLAINCTLSTNLFTHSRYIEQKAKDAIVDKFREKYRRRPSVDILDPDLRIQLYIKDDICSVMLNSSGDPLYKRGYRGKTNLAPINEVLAAGLILLSGWDKKSDFIDPMCGSATLSIEAALIAANIPVGSFRTLFGFEKWSNFDADLWEEVFDEAMEKINTDDMPTILAGEISKNVARKAAGNIAEANLKKHITLRESAFQDLVPPERKEITEPKQEKRENTDSEKPWLKGKKANRGVIIINPPYGERMDKDEDIENFYAEIGDTLKQNWAGYTAWIITSNLEAAKKIGLSAKPKIKMYNGALECRFMRYELYEGSRKNDKREYYKKIKK
ncbi:THUMP domain-containing class I SAM-dependent RNA methyltransferase [Bernardetia sp.]|uniref:THUMP domain-containing class I SAM-dependent RNA methyltransferase n=1 Tax=Bernardetia sp. TaxID=1937974 RepID=UPI0025C69E85|nr:THUMP domain-containing protein [Bernardetia sp.]